MRTKLLSTAAAVGCLVFIAESANALTVELALQQTGFNAQAQTTVDTTSSSLSFKGSFGNFDVNIVSATGSPTHPEPRLDTNTQNVSNGLLPATSPVPTCTSTCTLIVWITEIGLTVPAPGKATFQSAFTWNSVTGNTPSNGAGVAFANFIDNTDKAFGTGTPLASAVGTQSVESKALIFDNSVTITGTYSETVSYSETCDGGTCSFNSSDQITTLIPEPASLSLLGGGLLAFGAWRRRRDRKAPLEASNS